MCSLDLDVCSVWREHVRTARKMHECDCCGHTIHHGDSYLYHSHVYDGTAASEKMCAACWLVRADFVAAHGQAPTPDATYETIRECADGDPESPWRLHLAVLLGRIRTSQSARLHLNRRWHRVAVARSLAFTRRILLERAT